MLRWLCAYVIHGRGCMLVLACVTRCVHMVLACVTRELTVYPLDRKIWVSLSSEGYSCLNRSSELSERSESS